jgi:putative membrane protein
MKHRTTLHRGAAAIIASLGLAVAQQETDRNIGELSAEEFRKVNEVAGQRVKQLEAGSERLSQADQQLLQEIARGGTTLLELSRAAVDKVQTPSVKAFALAEVEEQETLNAKLKEIASVSDMRLPEDPPQEARQLIEQMQNQSGRELEQTYLRAGGVEGHEALKATMTRVQQQAESETLKELAAAALPLIEAHLNVARQELGQDPGVRQATGGQDEPQERQPGDAQRQNRAGDTSGGRMNQD